MLSLLNEVAVPKNKERCGKISIVHLLSSIKLFVIQKKFGPANQINLQATRIRVERSGVSDEIQGVNF